MFRILSHFGKAGPIFRRYELPGQFATSQPLPPCVREAAPYGASEERREISVYILGLVLQYPQCWERSLRLCRGIVRILREFREKGRLLLLFLCLLATGFGCVVISSATHYLGSSRFLTVQLAATALGVLVLCPADLHGLEGLAEHRELLFLFNAPAPPC